MTIRSRSMKKAYEVAHAIWSFFAVAFGRYAADIDAPMLMELASEPKDGCSVDELYNLADEFEDQRGDRPRWRTELGLSDLEYLREDMPRLFCDVSLRQAGRYLTDSYKTFERHLERYPLRGTRRAKDRDYYENQTRMELAFLSAFKGVERLLRTNQLHGDRIKKAFEKRPTLMADKTYRVRYESGPRIRTYAAMVEHLLGIRNKVAGHANPKARTVCPLLSLIHI